MFFYELYSNLPYQNLILFPLVDVVQVTDTIQQRNTNSQQIQQQVTNSEKEISIEIFQKQLIKKHKQSKSKLWTQQEDALLYQLVNQQLNWSQISERLNGKCELVCQRRYHRLLKLDERWPKENEKRIKYLYEERKMSWGEIQKLLPKYTKKQIKQRYKNFLEVDIKRAPWTVQQDLELWSLVKKYGHSWVQFTKIFSGRSQLQLKNRYNKFIKRLELRLLSEARIESQMKTLENNLDG